MATPFFLRQAVHLSGEMRVRLDRTGLRQNLPALDVVAFGASQQHAHVVAGLTLVEQFAEHFNASADRLDGRPNADNLDLFTHLDDPPLNTTRHHRAPPGDREHIFDRQQKWLVDRSLRRRNIGIQRIRQRHHRLLAQRPRIAFQRLQG
ncbi:MAG: hypothetical protein AW06_003485 [Candidatus Accumulibacter cognatus]|uniref:Uncharacterized protein n=1 Tax=Candidatus Accumulibacter cognatus TaxID=2954383 RepID=A0A080M2G2_9PROT|nr:MAG: hypothetical protein AW06_003485 [Candidatus Accumulibacter cognatus]